MGIRPFQGRPHLIETAGKRDRLHSGFEFGLRTQIVIKRG
jgi:hypothetical protein